MRISETTSPLCGNFQFRKLPISGLNATLRLRSRVWRLCKNTCYMYCKTSLLTGTNNQSWKAMHADENLTWYGPHRFISVCKLKRHLRYLHMTCHNHRHAMVFVSQPMPGMRLYSWLTNALAIFALITTRPKLHRNLRYVGTLHGNHLIMSWTCNSRQPS